MSTAGWSGLQLRGDPAREPCFRVVHRHTELMDLDGMGPAARRQRLHRHMHNEMQNLEISAQTLADFPDAPWELRLQLARQCWDEARHTELVHRRLLAHGGHKGEFPVMNYEWAVVCAMASLPARFTLQNRTFEAGEMDLFLQLQQQWRAAGDAATAAVYDGILADEVQHVRYANRWLQQACRQQPRTVFEVAKAIRFLQQVTAAMAPQPGDVNAAGVDLGAWTHLDVMTNVDDRRLAEFTDAEVAELLRREGFGSLAGKQVAP